MVAKGADLDPVDASLFLWSIRRQLWRDLIGAGRLTVEFEHIKLVEPGPMVDTANPYSFDNYYLETEGPGPYLDFLGPRGKHNDVLIADSGSPWPEATDEGQPFGPGGYPYHIPAGRRHDWDEFTMVTVESVWRWDEREAIEAGEFFHTRTRMTVLPSPVLDEYSWSGLARSDQLHVMNAVIEVAERHEARDIFVAMAAHPGSSPQLALFTRALEPLVRKVLGRPR